MPKSRGYISLGLNAASWTRSRPPSLNCFFFFFFFFFFQTRVKKVESSLPSADIEDSMEYSDRSFPQGKGKDGLLTLGEKRWTGRRSRKMIRKYNIVASIFCILSSLFFILPRTEINRIRGRVMMVRIILWFSIFFRLSKNFEPEESRDIRFRINKLFENLW